MIRKANAGLGPGKPGKSWNLTVAVSRTGKSWKRAIRTLRITEGP